MSQVLSEQSSGVRVFAALLRAYASTTRQLNAHLTADHGLTISDYEVLLRLARAPDRRMRRVDLAESVLLTASGITRLLEGLERADLVERARGGKLRQDDLEGGTFTISNLGMFGIERFTAVLNPPQAAILAVGATEERPVAREGGIVVRPTMTMTLTVDHRAVDGAPAADFLRTVKAFLEEPALAL